MTAAGDLVTQGRTWRRFLLADTGIGVFGNLATTLMTCFLAYAVLFPKGIVPDEWRLAAEQARFFEVSWGTADALFSRYFGRIPVRYVAVHRRRDRARPRGNDSIYSSAKRRSMSANGIAG